MAIIEELNDELFIRRFEDFNRLETENKGGNFTREGLRALFEYLENLSEDTGENINLDVISLCCDYSEYKNLNEYLRDYKTEIPLFNKNKATDEEKEKIEEEISDKTTLIKFGVDLDEGFIIQQY